MNNVLKEQKDLLYGTDCEIVVDRVEWIRSKKCHMINLTIFATNVNESLDVHPDGINFLIDAGWPILGNKPKPIIVSSLTLKG